MAILGVPSTSIVDSTSVGRSLITASDAAAARVIMELAAVDDVTFNSVSSVDGSFSGTLDTEVGGSNRLFNLGSDADVAAGNTEYYEASWAANVLQLYAKNTGTGVEQAIKFGSASTQIEAGGATNNIVFRTDGSYRAQITNTALTTKVSIGAAVSGLNIGTSGTPFQRVYSVNGYFDGFVNVDTDLTVLGDVDFTGLPTSDPVVAGRLWNNNDTVKISAG